GWSILSDGSYPQVAKLAFFADFRLFSAPLDPPDRVFLGSSFITAKRAISNVALMFMVVILYPVFARFRFFSRSITVFWVQMAIVTKTSPTCQEK
ncbi:MAG: hypothetical protein KC418_23930, partial [Anaerolineales bacterium]|nr:hypothetical protein [Anaerolineales bacterium]